MKENICPPINVGEVKIDIIALPTFVSTWKLQGLLLKLFSPRREMLSPSSKIFIILINIYPRLKVCLVLIDLKWRKTQFFLWEAVVKDISYHAFSHLRNFARKVQIAFSMLNYELEKNCLGQPRKWQQTDFSAESQKENWKDQEVFVAVQKGRNSCKITYLLWSWYGKDYFVFTTCFLLSFQKDTHCQRKQG